MERRPTITVEKEALGHFMMKLLLACHCPKDIAKTAAHILLEADLRGIGLQGLDYLPYLISSLKSGNVNPHGRPNIVHETPATALVAGNRGLGHPAAILAAETAVRKAHEVGSAAVGVTGSHDIFMLGYYAELMARERCIGIVFTSGAPLVHAYGGVEPVLSTNPISFGIPIGEDDPLVFDMATSAQSNARIRQAAYHGEQVPTGSGIGPDGEPATEARSIQRGSISPMAGHKGFGLSLCIALLSGPLTGSAVGGQLLGMLSGQACEGQGHFFIAVDPGSYGETSAFFESSKSYLDQIRNSKKAEGVDRIWIPGERAFAERRYRLERGIPILRATWEIITRIALELAVCMPVVVENRGK